MQVELHIELPDNLDGDTSLMELQNMHFFDKMVTITAADNVPVSARLTHMTFRS